MGLIWALFARDTPNPVSFFQLIAELVLLLMTQSVQLCAHQPRMPFSML